jgi:hypothetical protein
MMRAQMARTGAPTDAIELIVVDEDGRQGGRPTTQLACGRPRDVRTATAVEHAARADESLADSPCANGSLNRAPARFL